MPKFDFDMLIIGSGPAGQKAAIRAAQLEKRVAIIEKRGVVGGICINLGTIPSKTLREAVVYLSGYRQHSVYGESYSVKERITMEDLLTRTDHVIRTEIDITRKQLRANGVELINAEASFADPHTLILRYIDGRGESRVTAEKIVIAVGTTATRDPNIQFDGQNIFTSDDLLGLNEVPRTLTVVGGGVIGIEYACIFALMGVRVTLIDKREKLLSFVDEEIVDALVYHLRQHQVTFRLEETVSHVEKLDDKHESVRITTESGKVLQAEKALYSIGRTGATAGLNLEAAGLTANKRGQLDVGENYQTPVDHIYAVGDIIGFPSLASTSMEQGRLAASHAFGKPLETFPDLLPYGIYTIPEISIVGKNEDELTEAEVPYEIGKAYYRETARGQIIGDQVGMLKLIFHRESKLVLGVSVIGENASELVHIGQAVMALGGTIDYFTRTVFNYPTLAECYKNAALDGLQRLCE